LQRLKKYWKFRGLEMMRGKGRFTTELSLLYRLKIDWKLGGVETRGYGSTYPWAKPVAEVEERLEVKGS
jgi:hypothetical protein